MTDKDCALIADILGSKLEDIDNIFHTAQKKQPYWDLVEEIAHAFARSLALRNPHFNRDEFLQACGIEQNKNTCWNCNEFCSLYSEYQDDGRTFCSLDCLNEATANH